jgi:ATPase family associated with various cellular activities (AAA)
MSGSAPIPIALAFTPSLRAEDALGDYWLRQVTYRLRREICWLWHERGALATSRGETLPPFSDKLCTALDLVRYADEKKDFFARNGTARYLTALLASPALPEASPRQGSFAWVARELDLGRAGCFILALALLPAVDAAALTVMAACLNDPARTHPTLALAQRLWENPEEILPFGDVSHPLFRSGLIQSSGGIWRDGTASEWELPFSVPALCARVLLFNDAPIPAMLHRIEPKAGGPLPDAAKLLGTQLKVSAGAAVRVVPVIGTKGAPLAETAAAIAALAGRPVVEFQLEHALHSSNPAPALPPILAWLHGYDLFVRLRDQPCCGAEERRGLLPFPLPSALPLTVFVGLEDKTLLHRLPMAGLLPPMTVPPMTFQARHERWRNQLGKSAARPPLTLGIAECARRFRYERGIIDAIANTLVALERPLKPADLTAACRAEAVLDIGDLAQLVSPRFRFAELMLPAKQTREIQEIIKGMRALTRVHYDWGTARVWNESGLCALFAGPPGTGKTMAAEVIAAELDLPLYRIDLSQVVNKYIGETEKNLRRLFDAADASDVVLFFDEADALFGKRTEVKDAHDRYANLEISYLLERMERFKGLGVLATNRKQDLDDAFLRRLRFVIDFPLPGEEERRRMWRQMIPPQVVAPEVDFDFLARQFPLAGGHIRSIIFHACLQSAEPRGRRELTMLAILAAVKSEYEKLNRSISLEQFGVYEKDLARP